MKTSALPIEPLLPGGRYAPALRYGALRLLGTANGGRWHRVCAGRASVLHRATYAGSYSCTVLGLGART